MDPTRITRLPDGEFKLSTLPGTALSEAQLRQALMTPNADPRVVDDLVSMAKKAE